MAVVQLRVVHTWAIVAGPRLQKWRGALGWRRGGRGWLCFTIRSRRASIFTLCEANMEGTKYSKWDATIVTMKSSEPVFGGGG